VNRQTGTATPARPAPVVNFLSIDVEDYFQVEGFDQVVREADWERHEPRFHLGLEWLLQVLDSVRIKATFFVLGWLAERHPQEIREIIRKGHEIGVHGYYHRRIDTQTPESFAAELRRALEVLRGLGAAGIRGHRAPSFSITPAAAWAWSILRDGGLSYDASLSVRHFPAGREPWTRPDPGPQRLQLSGGEPFLVFPQAYLPGLARFPFAGGGFFRLYPYALTRWGIRAWNRRGVPVTVYVHPWEFDPDQPRFPAPALRRWKHYVNLETNREKFAQLLQDFSFRPLGSYHEE